MISPWRIKLLRFMGNPLQDTVVALMDALPGVPTSRNVLGLSLSDAISEAVQRLAMDAAQLPMDPVLQIPRATDAQPLQTSSNEQVQHDAI